MSFKTGGEGLGCEKRRAPTGFDKSRREQKADWGGKKDGWVSSQFKRKNVK